MPMRIALLLLMAAGVPVIVRAMVAHHRTSLLHALVWSLIAWVAWSLAFALEDPEEASSRFARYLALCLTGCAGVAVLGARRPQVSAWNFVVAGLLAVMLLPLLETWLLGTHSVNDGLRVAFLSGTIAVGALNYLPTRFGPAALVLLMACAGELVRFFAPASLASAPAGMFDALLSTVPWLAWLSMVGRRDRSDFDRIWLSFRDAWGLMWSQRVREQFNHAAENAGWNVRLHWRGLKGEAKSAEEVEKRLATLRATLQRFLQEEGQ